MKCMNTAGPDDKMVAGKGPPHHWNIIAALDSSPENETLIKVRTILCR